MATLSTSYLPWRILCIIAVAILAVRWLHWEATVGRNRRRLIRENNCLPPRHYPHKGILGHLLGIDLIRENLKNGREGHFHESARLRNYRESNTLQVRLLRGKFITTIEPENVKTVLSTKFQDFDLGTIRRLAMTPVFGRGIFTSDGAHWERSRALIRPNFIRSQVADLDVFEHHIQNLLHHIPRDGRTVDLQELFFKLSMDSSTEFLFGRSTNTLVPNSDNGDAEMFAKAFTRETENMAQDFRSAGLNRLFNKKQRRNDVAVIHKYTDDIIEKALRRDVEKTAVSNDSKKQYVFLYELMKLTQDHYTIRSESLNVLLAGRDTTASLLSHTFFELARQPGVWQKLQTEIDQLQGRAPDYETLKSMKYVKFVLNESLRLRPVVPGNTRMCIRDTVLPLGGGLDGKSPMLVRKGTTLSYSVWSMHRRTDLFGPDALEFKPERWETLRPGWEYLPFNGGPRICIGQNFALTEASYTLVRILQHFKRIEARDERPWSEFATLTLAVGNGVKVALFED